jgi:hypothetical protein
MSILEHLLIFSAGLLGYFASGVFILVIIICLAVLFRSLRDPAFGFKEKLITTLVFTLLILWAAWLTWLTSSWAWVWVHHVL